MVEISEPMVRHLSKSPRGQRLLRACDIEPIIDEADSPNTQENVIEKGDRVRIKWQTHPDPDLIGTEEKIVIDDSPLAQILLGKNVGDTFFYSEARDDREGTAFTGSRKRKRDDIYKGKITSIHKKE